MPKKQHDDTDQRLRKILQGAFAGPPTPLKDIPTVTGKARRVGAKAIQSRKRRAARQKRKSAA